MFKKLFQIAVTLATLIGAHVGYTRGFALVAARLAIPEEDLIDTLPEIAASRSTLRGIELAREHLGADHWAAQHGLPINYFDPERGFYMYTQSYKRLKNGQRLELRPFAVIAVSKDGKSHKVITSDEAVVDFNKPYMSMKGNGGATRIVHAQMAGNVLIRDDKGTNDGHQDDLVVGPLTHLDYDEKESNITSESDVILKDRDLTATGKGLLIRLRRGAGASSGGGGGMSGGFEAEAAYLRKDVHLVVKNVGSTGVLPGKSKEDGKGQTPLDLKCAGEMEILLPPSRPAVAIGPPHLNRPADPTYVKFQVKVVVLRGITTPDQLNCDELLLTLMPTPKAASSAAKPASNAAVAVVEPGQDVALADAGQAGAGAAAKPGGTEDAKPSGPLTELKLREALATGHAVWIQSASQGLTARCIELKYKKFADGVTPDETYLNGGGSNKLYAEKIERHTTGTNIGSIKSVLRLRCMDATIFDDGQGGASTVVARGPGKAEERPSMNASIERTAWWEDQMILRTEAGPVAPGSPTMTADGKPAKGSLRRELTLTGVSKLVDHVRETTLDARSKIIARFKSAPKAAPDAPDGSPKIESLQALDDVHLTAPNRTMTARHQFDAVFEEDAPGGLLVQNPAAKAPAANAAPTPVPGPAFPVPKNPSLASAKVAAPDPSADAEAPKPDKPAPALAKVEPAVDVRANRVWAKILHRGEGGKDEFREARLRGDVMVHQDPAPGKVRGTDASGEALDLMSQGEGLMKFRVLDADPAAVASKARLAAAGRPPIAPILARVETEEMTIEGHDIGLDQKANYAEVPGPGKLMEWAERGLLDDKGLDAPKVRPAVLGMPAASTKARLVITWNEEMKFHGKTTDPQGNPSAKAEFRGKSAMVHTPDGKSAFRNGVTATMENSLILCEAMDVFTDKPVAMNRDPRAKEKKDPTVPPEPAAQIAFIDARGRNRVVDEIPYPGVDVISQKVYPGTKDVREKQRIRGDHVTYDRRTGDFTAPGQGLVYLYKRKGGDKAKKPAAIQTAGPGRNGAGGVAAPDREALTPIELTKVSFSEGMQGRFGVNKDKADVEDKIAEFYGNVQAINAIVKTPGSDLDFDKPPADAMFLTSEYMRVVSHPLGEGKAQQLLYAKDNAQARTIDRTIQGDRITYDSSTENAYVYGEEGREVVLIDQKNPGQPSSVLRGKSGRYNRETRQASIVDPQTINFADLKSGIRPKPNAPDAGGSPKPLAPMEQQRVPLPRTGRQNVERGSNSGR